jgi:hypothetical protein
VSEVELAAALRRQGPATMKLTLFFSRHRVSDADIDNVLAYASAAGYDVAPLRALIATLAAGVDSPRLVRKPLAGIGVEVPVGERPKINVYLQPVL